jgi:transposase
VLDEQIAALTSGTGKGGGAGLPAGLGKLTSVVVCREVCDWRRFKNRRQVSSYTGLCPGEYSSGAKRVPGAVTKHGNPRLACGAGRTGLAFGALPAALSTGAQTARHPGQGAQATGGARKKAIVAVARQLAVDLWRWQSGQCSAEKLGLGGSSQRALCWIFVVGQLSHNSLRFRSIGAF